MKKRIGLLLALLLVIGLTATAQITKEKAFATHEGIYVLDNDTLKVTDRLVIFEGVEYEVEIDFGSKRNYGIQLYKNEQMYFINFQKKGDVLYMYFLEEGNEEAGQLLTLNAQAKIE